VEGLGDVQRLLKQLPPRMRSKHVRKATRQAIALVRNDIKARAPVGELGRLVKLVRIRPRRGKRGYQKASLEYRTEGSAGDPKNAFFWRFLEFGTKHIPAQPFVFPAADRQFKRVVRKVQDAVRVGVREEVRKTGGRA
jgi:HK97 gp10 family phage protein